MTLLGEGSTRSGEGEGIGHLLTRSGVDAMAPGQHLPPPHVNRITDTSENITFSSPVLRKWSVIIPM